MHTILNNLDIFLSSNCGVSSFNR